MDSLKKQDDPGGQDQSDAQMDLHSQLTEMTRVARHLQSIVIQDRIENSALKAEVQKLEAEVRALQSTVSPRRRTDKPFLPMEDLKVEETEARNRALRLRVEELFDQMTLFQEKDKTRAQKLVEAQRAAVDAYNRVERLEEERDELVFKHEANIHSLQERLDSALGHIDALKEELDLALESQAPPNQETAPQAKFLMDVSLAERQESDCGAFVVASLALVGILCVAAAIATFSSSSPIEEPKEYTAILPIDDFGFGTEIEYIFPVNVCMTNDLPPKHFSLAFQHLAKWGQSQLSHLADTLSVHDWRKLLHHHLVHYERIQQLATPVCSEISRDVMEKLRDLSDFYPIP